jgi:hypothetical protein
VCPDPSVVPKKVTPPPLPHEGLKFFSSQTAQLVLAALPVFLEGLRCRRKGKSDFPRLKLFLLSPFWTEDGSQAWEAV